MMQFCMFFLGLVLLLGISGKAFAQQNVQRDSDGMLLPHLSYHEVVMRGMNFILNEHDGWFKGDKSVLKDEVGTELPAYVLYANLQKNGELFPDAIDRFVSYPAFHHAAYIAAFLKYYEYSGDQNALSKAKMLADWNIAHSTPADWPYGSLPYSTYYQGQPGGFRDGNTIMTDKPAMMGLAYLGLHKATGEEKYLNASFAISRTLAQTQSREGNWPFRVNPQTEEVKEQYTSSAVYALQLFEGLDKFRGTNLFKKNADRTFQWIMKNPSEPIGGWDFTRILPMIQPTERITIVWILFVISCREHEPSKIITQLSFSLTHLSSASFWIVRRTMNRQKPFGNSWHVLKRWVIIVLTGQQCWPICIIQQVISIFG